jgi:hypothetical protein
MEPRAKRPAETIAIDVQQGELKIGSPIALRVTMTNVSDHPIYFACELVDGPVFRQVGLRRMDIEIRDANGEAIAETECGMTIHGRSLVQPQVKVDPHTVGKMTAGRKGVAGVLTPGKALLEESDLSREFVLNKPGSYTIQAIDRRGDTDTEQVVLSNKLTVTLTGGQPK